MIDSLQDNRIREYVVKLDQKFQEQDELFYFYCGKFLERLLKKIQYPNKSKLFTRQLLHLLRSSQKSRPTIHIAFLFWSSYNFSHSIKHWIPESFSRARKILISLISSESSMYIVQFGQPSRSLADSCWLAQCQEWTECRGKEGQAKNVHVCMISQVNINNLYCIYTVRLAKYLK